MAHLTDEQMKARVMQDGISSGEWNVYREWWNTGRGYEENRETIDRVDDAIRRVQEEGNEYDDAPMRPDPSAPVSNEW